MKPSILALAVLSAAPFVSNGSELYCEKPPQMGQISENIHFLVDKSGSISIQQTKTAIHQVLEIAAQSTDHLNVAATVFAGVSVRADFEVTLPNGTTENTRWLKLPSGPNVDLLENWLTGMTVADGTNALNPLLTALGEHIDPLTIIVVTDGAFHQYEDPITGLEISKNGGHPILQYVTQWQQMRDEVSWIHPATIGWIHIAPTPTTVESESGLADLRQIVQASDHFLCSVSAPPAPPAPPCREDLEAWTDDDLRHWGRARPGCILRRGVTPLY